MPRFVFTQAMRLKTPEEFQRVYARKRSVSDAHVIIYGCPNDREHSRVGLSVSKKVGNAVVRNRVKRLFREAYRLSQHELPGGIDFILIPRLGAPTPTLEQFRSSLLTLSGQLAASFARRPPR